MKKLFFIVCLLLTSCVILAIERTDSDERFVLEKVAQVLHSIKSSKCRSDFNYTLKSLQNGESWAIGMFDASVKSPIGVEYGNEYQFGNFDQCMKSRSPENEIDPKYCLVNVNLDWHELLHIARRNESTTSTSKTVQWGVCLPSSCSNEEIEHLMKHLTGSKQITINPKLCQSNRSVAITELKFSEIIFGLVLFILFAIIVICTCLHVRVMTRVKNRKLRNDVFQEEIIDSFSLITNIKKLGKQSKDEMGLSCINGIKTLSMLLILSGHSLLFLVGGPVENPSFFQEQSQNIRNAFLLNSPLLVDSFLLLSGFLFTRLALAELDKRQGRVNFGLLYIFRYIRLTPAYFAMISLYATWFIRLGDGPLWSMRIAKEQERCLNSWWINLLYINNYVGTEELCMFQSWYLAADTQLFILAPLLIYPLWRFRKVGINVTAVVGIISMIIPFYITYTKKLDPTFIIRPSEIADLSANDYFINIYGKTHMRATAYILGIVIGFIVYQIQKKNVLIEKNLRRILWILTGSLGLYSMFSITFYYTPSYHYSHLEAALYNCLHRLGWNIFISWLIIACITSEKGLLKKFLSSRALVAMSRLTYCAYLTNGFVEFYLAASIRSPKYLSVISLLCETLSHVILTFAAALVLCLMFESPIHGIEKMLFRRFSPKDRSMNRAASESDKFNVNCNSSSSSSSSSSDSPA